MAASGKLVMIPQDDGSVKIDARGFKGTEKEMLAELEALAQEVGGELFVEKHEPATHSHHTHDHRHHHKH